MNSELSTLKTKIDQVNIENSELRVKLDEEPSLTDLDEESSEKEYGKEERK